MNRKKHLHFENISSSIDAALWVINIGSKTITANAKWFTTLGLKNKNPREISFDIWKKYIHPNDLPNLLTELESVFRGKSKTFTFAYRMRHSTKGWVWMMDTGKVVEWDQNIQPMKLKGARTEINKQVPNPSQSLKSKQYKSLMQNIPGAFYQGLADKDWSMLYISEDIESLTGYSPATFVSKQPISFEGIIHKEDQEKVRKSIDEALSKDINWEIEYRINHKDESIKWLFERGKASKERVENKIMIEGFVMDITDKKRAEQSLIKTKEFLDETNEVALVGGWELDLDTNKVFWSKVTKLIHEVPEDYECTLQEALSFYKPGSNFDNLQKLLNRALTEGRPSDPELEIITAKGNEKWVKITAHPELQNGEVTRLYGSFQDITKRKKDSLKILRQNRFRELVASVSSRFVKSTVQEISSIMDETLSNCIKYFDTDRAFIFQISHKDSTISNTYDFRKEGIPNTQDRVQKRSLKEFPWFAELISKKEIFSVNDVEDLPSVAKNEQREWKEQQIKSILFIRFDINNQPAGVIGLASHTRPITWKLDDISDLKVISNIVSDALSKYQLELNLIKEKLRAEKANNAKSEFLANMSHEIRTPLNAILGFSEVLYNTAELEPVKRQLNIILNSGKSLLALINEMLDFSKIESGNVSLNPEMIDLALLLNKIEQLLSGQAKKNSVDLSIKYQSKIPDRIFVDHFRLQQILLNLASNAIKFTRNGSVEVNVDFKFNKNDHHDLGELTIKITDTGIGISERNLHRIFESFHQADHLISKNYGGTGLGLAISKKLVELMKGEISAKSELGRGSSFTVQLPDIKYLTQVSYSKSPINQSHKILFKSSKILVIDDVEINNELIRAYLDGHDVEVYTCNSGIEGISLAKEIMPDLVLLDLRMPVMSGRETASIIKSLKGCGQTPIIAFTASLSTNEGLEKYFSGLLSKPIEENELFHELKRFLPYSEISN